MAAPGKQSVWGSFLQSAVTGIETRLDTMLDEDEERQQNAARANAPKPSPSPAPSRPSSATRSSSGARMTANDRLQARLAKAMAGKGQDKPLSPRHSADSSSDQRPRLSLDDRAPSPKIEASASEAADSVKDPGEQLPAKGPDEEHSAAADAEAGAAKTSEPTAPTPDVPTIKEPTDHSEEQKASRPSGETTNRDLESLKAQHQEEVQEYVERIDSLQSKLAYLSESAAKTAKDAASAAASGSSERTLAEKDEKIALLLQEGQKRSSSEGRYRTTIKKLRQQIADLEKQSEEQAKATQKTTAELETVRKRLEGDDAAAKRQEETRKATAALQKEIAALKKDQVNKEEQIKRIEQDAAKKAEQVEAAHKDAMDKALATERSRQKEVEDQLAAARAENESLSDRARLDALDWREKLDRAAERSNTVEAELKHELRNLEAKVEAMRTTAEEATTGSGGEAQLKLLRQIETLQSQYASASDNWQGIEGSLLAKVSTLEKERDEAQRRESEMRKKAREAANRLRTQEDELQATKPALEQAQHELETCKEQLARLRASAKTTETALEQARSDLEKQQRNAAREFPADQERRSWLDEVQGAPRGQSRPESPLLSVSRTFSSDFAGLPVPLRGSRRAATPGSNGEAPPDGLTFSLGRRMSSQPPVRPGPLPTSNSGLFSTYEGSTDSPHVMSPSAQDRDDATNTVPSSPRAMAQDMVSVSTAAAGPSVQLVERMSAAIRRLEAEKVAAKEEMARVCSQRDEARSDMVGLMKEMEDAKEARERVKALEGEVGDLNGRYEATLELLGEKSELVEELRADVQDVKEMYRELVERTVK